MKRLFPVLLLALGLLSAPSSNALPTPGFASPNIEFLGNVPLHADTAGAHLRGGWLYVTSSHELSIYDVHDPTLPVLTSTVPLPQRPYFSQEDVDTNGSVLLVSTLGSLFVFDVRDKRVPTLLSTLAGGDEHTITCVLDCRWAYGSYGAIIDLRDPVKPRFAGDWTTAAKGGPGAQHDVTEVAPGLVMTSTQAMWLLDARHDPAHPKVIARAENGDKRFVHANLWPRATKDKLLLVGGETAGVGTGSTCGGPKAGAFMTYDTTGWSRTGTMKRLDSYRPKSGAVSSGGAAYETYCAHWFTPRPGWHDGGDVAVGWYEHGTRFLKVARTGKINETGWYLPVATTASAAYWVTRDLVYVLDYQRGLDILRVHDKPVPSPVAAGAYGLRPDQAPAHPRLRLPMTHDMVGDRWRCGNPAPPLSA